MKCPSCNNTPISFFDWAKGLKWHKTNCKSCGQGLKAAPSTRCAFVLMLIIGTAVIFISAYKFHIGEPFNFVIGFVVILIAANIAYSSIDGYTAVE